MELMGFTRDRGRIRHTKGHDTRRSGATCVNRQWRSTVMTRKTLMTRNRTVAAATVPLAALLLSACVSQQTYDAMVADNNKLKAQIAAMQAQSSFVEGGDLLFPEGGYRLSPAGQAELANNIAPKLKAAPANSKFVVYGYTDNLPVGPALQQQGIPDHLVLTTGGADE